LKARILGSENEPYDACPYCLTEITSAESCHVVEAKSSPETDETKDEGTVVALAGRTVRSPQATQCAHHFGYLSERSSKDKIPEECMICDKVLECMLGRLKK
jgi:hypothetical protein